MESSQKEKKNSELFLHFRNLHKIWNALKKKNEPQMLFVCEIIDCKKPGYLSD